MRFKSILRRWSMRSDSNFSVLLTISSSIQNVRCSFSRVRINDFAIIIFASFKIHTLRFRKTFRKRLRRMFNTSDLKSSSISSTKFFLNCSHNVSFFRFSRSYEIIVVCTKLFLSILRKKEFDCESKFVRFEKVQSLLVNRDDELFFARAADNQTAR
jgi:hypothetical protein